VGPVGGRTPRTTRRSTPAGGDLAVTGRAPDGTVEVCAEPSADFCLGVQWHPERPTTARSADLPLVPAFVAAAERFRATAG